MTPVDLISASDDPIIRSVQAQAFAIKLLARGLTPKQVAIITNISLWKAVDLRRGLNLPDAGKRSTKTKALQTILRQRQLRAGASFFVGVYRRLAGQEHAGEIDWHRFLKSYDIYVCLAQGSEDTWPILPIDEAYTVVTGLWSSLSDIEKCDRHETHYLFIPDNDRSWGCPYCKREGSSLDQALDNDGSAQLTECLLVPSGATPVPDCPTMAARSNGKKR